MNMRISQSLLTLLLLTFSSLAPAVPVDFDAEPIACFYAMPGGVGTPADCTPFAVPRPNGYSIIDATFGWGFPNPVPPPVPPEADIWGSDRDFINPVDQDLIIFIFVDTFIDVQQGGPFVFFASGTLDGVVKVTFATPVTGDGPLVLSAAAVIPDVPAGPHTLDMEFGVLNPGGQPGQGTFASELRVGIAAVPAPGTAALLLGGMLLLFGGRGRRAA